MYKSLSDHPIREPHGRRGRRDAQLRRPALLRHLRWQRIRQGRVRHWAVAGSTCAGITKAAITASFADPDTKARLVGVIGPRVAPVSTRVRIKICCISSVDEAMTAVRLGADALGLVSHMPSGPGVIDECLHPRPSRSASHRRSPRSCSPATKTPTSSSNSSAGAA